MVAATARVVVDPEKRHQRRKCSPYPGLDLDPDPGPAEAEAEVESGDQPRAGEYARAGGRRGARRGRWGRGEKETETRGRE